MTQYVHPATLAGNPDYDSGCDLDAQICATSRLADAADVLPIISLHYGLDAADAARAAWEASR